MRLKVGDPVIWFRAHPAGTKIPATYLGDTKGRNRVMIAWVDKDGKKRTSCVYRDSIDDPRLHSAPVDPLLAGQDLKLAGGKFGFI